MTHSFPFHSVLSCKSYQKKEREIGVKIEADWKAESVRRHAEEKSNAETDVEGFPSITVSADGGWLKQSRGHSHTSTSG